MNPELKATIESIKEMLRIVIVAIIPVILAGINLVNGAISINWQIVQATALVTFLVAVLKGLDKGTHFYNKEVNNEVGKSQGIIPF